MDAGAREVGAELVGLLAPRVRAGQIVFADAMRRAIHATAPEVFDCMEFTDDEAFLEPMAIAAFSVHNSTASRCWSPDAVVTVPVGGRGMSLVRQGVPAFERAVFGDHGRLCGIESAARRHHGSADRALRAIDACWPELSGLIADTVRYLVIFEQDEQNSFASRATHGVAYVNVALGHSVAFFIEDLAHQCGHVLFSAAWVGGTPLLSVDDETSMSDMTGVPGDDRTLEVALHGVVTLALMVTALDRHLADARPAGESSEARARLAFALSRMGSDIELLSRSDVLTSAGGQLIDAVTGIAVRMAERYCATLVECDFDCQPYNFDYRVFLEHNPMWMSVSRDRDLSHA